VSQDIGTALTKKSKHHTLVIRSTVLPGTTEGQVVPILEARSGRPLGEGYSVFYNPEFLREGTAIADFFEPPLTLVGTFDEKPAEPVEDLYRGVEAPFHTVSIKVAEMVKYSANAFHALKITFANEIGRIAKCLGADSYPVMDYLCRDTKLNISKAYLRPGFAFGGSCLPKDLRALTYKAKELDVTVPMLSAILASNEEHIESALRIIQSTKSRKVGLLGLSFKPGTDDLRESPLVALAERLIGKGYELFVYDPLVNLDHLVGANKTYILREIPHISRLMVSSVEKVVAKADIIVVGNGSKEFRILSDHEFADDQTVVDLSGILKGAVKGKAAYHGICW
jgi:GDP-mannose 6-dehydrogenase